MAPSSRCVPLSIIEVIEEVQWLHTHTMLIIQLYCPERMQDPYTPVRTRTIIRKYAGEKWPSRSGELKEWIGPDILCAGFQEINSLNAVNVVAGGNSDTVNAWNQAIDCALNCKPLPDAYLSAQVYFPPFTFMHCLFLLKSLTKDLKGRRSHACTWPRSEEGS
jgi:hypothetical protein